MSATPAQLREAARQLDEGESVSGALYALRNTFEYGAYTRVAVALTLRLEAALAEDAIAPTSYGYGVAQDLKLAAIVRAALGSG